MLSRGSSRTLEERGIGRFTAFELRFADKGPRNWQRSLAGLLTVLLATLAPAGPVLAAPPKSKVVTALIGAAQKEFDGGNFDRAGELFLDVWKQDKTQTAALYNASRAMHLAGNLDKADDLYREIVKEAIIAWLWAEGQKAMKGLPTTGAAPLLVAV